MTYDYGTFPKISAKRIAEINYKIMRKLLTVNAAYPICAKEPWSDIGWLHLYFCSS
jgi:hypothetical protein